MEKKEKKRCKVCGAKYEACYSCDRKHSWRMHTDTEEHFYIFGVLMNYQVTHDAKQAYNALRKRCIDFHDTAGFLPNVQKLLAEINTLAHENSRAKKVSVEAIEINTKESMPGEATEKDEQ